MAARIEVRPEVDDEELSRLHALAFEAPFARRPWRRRLEAHSLSWVGALDGSGRLIGFANVVWDGGAHAVLLDLLVHPGRRRKGLGTALVAQAAAEAAGAGCSWLHVDFEPRLHGFYVRACGFAPSAAGVLQLGLGPGR